MYQFNNINYCSNKKQINHNHNKIYNNNNKLYKIIYLNLNINIKQNTVLYIHLLKLIIQNKPNNKLIIKNNFNNLNNKHKRTIYGI